MSGIAIYLEGGGDGPAGKAALRRGMDAFLRPLRETAQRRRWTWKVVACGSRGKAFDCFRYAHDRGATPHVFLLVDAEAFVTLPPGAHLRARDGWDTAGIHDGTLHLMVQTMETWIAADIETLRSFYGVGFKAGELTRRNDLEHEPRQDLARQLKRATESTRHGAYHKIHHAERLLQMIDRDAVRRRCPSCDRLFRTVYALCGA